jgi:hypothetical protein
MRLKYGAAAFGCVLSIMSIGAGSALAGEITGPSSPNGGLGHPLYQTIDGQHVLNGASACAFSGLNNPLDGAEAGPGRVQSYGQLVADGQKSVLPSPGVACNPTAAGSGGA